MKSFVITKKWFVSPKGLWKWIFVDMDFLFLQTIFDI